EIGQLPMPSTWIKLSRASILPFRSGPVPVQEEPHAPEANMRFSHLVVQLQRLCQRSVHEGPRATRCLEAPEEEREVGLRQAGVSRRIVRLLPQRLLVVGDVLLPICLGEQMWVHARFEA